MREWRRQRQKETDEIVILPSSDGVSVQHATTAAIGSSSSSGATQESSLLPGTSQASSTITDPDSRYRTDDDSTRASLLAFAELEGRLRAKQAMKDVTDTAQRDLPPTAAGTAAASPTAAQSAPTAQPSTPSTEDDLLASSMDAFAALELMLAKKRLQKKQEYLEDPTARTTEQTLTTADKQPIQLTVLTPPRMPEPQECCGMSCPNCVSKHYSGRTSCGTECVHPTLTSRCDTCRCVLCCSLCRYGSCTLRNWQSTRCRKQNSRRSNRGVPLLDIQRLVRYSKFTYAKHPVYCHLCTALCRVSA